MIIPILIAFSLNFDTFSVSIVEGSQVSKPNITHSLKVGLIFGCAQALLTYLGTVLGMGFKNLIANTDHWVAFVLLLGIGIKMIEESIKKENCQSKIHGLKLSALLFLAMATSIDALIIGVTIAFLKESIVSYIFFIGVITFIVSCVGYHSGRSLKKICGNHAKAIGGIILISIGIKTLIQHLYFGG